MEERHTPNKPPNKGDTIMKINTAKLAAGRMVKGSSNFYKEGQNYFSYATHMAYEHTDMPVLYVNPRHYSRTTSKQMALLKRFYRNKGFSIVNWDTGEVMK